MLDALVNMLTEKLGFKKFGLTMKIELAPIKRKRKSERENQLLWYLWDVYYTSRWRCQADQVLYKSGVWGSLCWRLILESHHTLMVLKAVSMGRKWLDRVGKGLLQHESSGWWGRSSKRDWKGRGQRDGRELRVSYAKWERSVLRGNGQLCKLRLRGWARWNWSLATATEDTDQHDTELVKWWEQKSWTRVVLKEKKLCSSIFF